MFGSAHLRNDAFVSSVEDTNLLLLYNHTNKKM